MKIGIYHPFTHLPDNYSLSYVVVEQMMMILEEGWECHFWTHKNFKGTVPEGVIIHAVLPSGEKEEIKKAITGVCEMDAVLTHDVAYIDSYKHHAEAIREIAEANPKIKWLHWVHSAPKPSEKKRALPNSVYIGMNYTDLMLLAEQFQIPVAKCRVVYNARSPDVFWGWHEETKQFVDKHGLLDVDILFYYPFDTGRFTAKGGENIIAFTDALNKNGVVAKTVMINAAANHVDRRKWVDGWSKLSENVIFTSISMPQWEVVCPSWFIREIGSISDGLPLFSRSEGCSLIMLEAGLMGNILMLNEDFRPILEFADMDEAIYFKLSSDRQTTTYNPSKEAYLDDMAKRFIAEVKSNKAVRFRRKVLKRFNRKWIWEQQLKPLLS